MPRIFNPATHNVSATEYVVRNTPPLLVVLFIIVLLIWTLQELLIRDAYPLEANRTLHHFLDMASVLWGSFATGYIFHFIVDHIPNKLKAYDEQIEVDRGLIELINTYKRFIETVSYFNRERDETVTCSLYILDEVGVEYWRRTVEMALQRLKVEFSDPSMYQETIDTTKKQLRDSIDEMLLSRGSLDWRHYDALISSRKILYQERMDYIVWEEEPFGKFQVINLSIRTIFRLVRYRVEHNEYCLAHLYNVVQRSSHQDWWDDHDREIEEQEQAEGMRSLTSSSPFRRPPHPSEEDLPYHY